MARASKPDESLRYAMATLGWATAREIDRLADHGKGLAWTLGTLAKWRERGDVEYRYGPPDREPEDRQHEYKLSREGN